MARDVSVPSVDAIELNISCPTRQPGGGNFALNEDKTYEVVKACRSMTDKPLWAKLSPNAGEITAVAEAAEKAGADAITVSNTILGLKINVDTRRSCIGNGYGGISGPGVKPIVLRMVHQCSKSVKIPIIGCGGIMKVEDVVEYLLAGATRGRSGIRQLPQSDGDDRPHRGLWRSGAQRRVSRVLPSSPARCWIIRRGTPMKQAWSASAELPGP